MWDLVVVQGHMNTAVTDGTSNITRLTCFAQHVQATVHEVLVPLHRSTSSAHHTQQNAFIFRAKQSKKITGDKDTSKCQELLSHQHSVISVGCESSATLLWEPHNWNISNLLKSMLKNLGYAHSNSLHDEIFWQFIPYWVYKFNVIISRLLPKTCPPSSLWHTAEIFRCSEIQWRTSHSSPTILGS